MKLETKVGLFVTLGLVFLFALTTQVNNFKLFEKDGYPLFAYLQSVDGLEINSKVKSKGFEIGSVTNFELEKDKVTVHLQIFDGVAIPVNSSVSIKQESMLGVKYLDISFGDSTEMLKPNDYIFANTKYASFDETSNSINDAAVDFKGFISRLDALIAKNQENFTQMISNFNQVGREFSQTGKLINERLPGLFTRFDTVGADVSGAADKFGNMSSEFKQTGEIINKDLPVILTKFQKAEDSFQGVMDDNRQTLKSAIANIDSAFAEINSTAKKVGGAFEKLDTYLASTTQSELGVNFRNEFMSRDGYNKVYFGIDYSPKPTIHYLVDLVSTDDYRINETTELHEKGRTLVSAQYGKDFNNLRLRAGVIESTGGVGADYFMKNKKIAASVDLYDFNAYNDARGKNPHLKTGIKYNYMKHVNLYGGIDNILNSKATNATFGVGINFVDQDLKYLIGSSAGFAK